MKTARWFLALRFCRALVRPYVAVLLAATICGSTTIADELSARGLILRQVGTQWEIDARTGVHTGVASFAYHIRIEHWRGGQLISVAVDEDIAVQAVGGCTDCVSCGGSCETLCNGLAVTGTCGRLKYLNCGQMMNNNDCECDHKCPKKVVLNLTIGDTVVFSITPPPGFPDDEPDDNLLSVTF